MTTPSSTQSRFDLGALIQAASQGKHRAIQTLLAGQKPSVDLSNYCTLAVSQAATHGHARVVEQLLPWTTLDDAQSPVDQSTKHDPALLAAVEGKHWEVVELLLPVAMKSSMGRSLFIEHAPKEMVRSWLDSGEVLTVYKSIVKAKKWSDLDDFAQVVNEPQRRDWLRRHGSHLPNTLAKVTAGDRSEKAGNLPASVTSLPRRRLRS